MKKALLVILLCITAFITGCNFNPEPKEFSKDGITVTLTEAFKENDNDLHKVTYASTKVIFTGNYETLSDNLTLLEYATKCLSYGDEASDATEYNDDVTSFVYGTYENTVEDVILTHDVTYKYMLICMKGESGKYYCMNFGTTKDTFDDYKDQIFEWAKTIKVA